jgi:hypothetical protein
MGQHGKHSGWGISHQFITSVHIKSRLYSFFDTLLSSSPLDFLALQALVTLPFVTTSWM